MSFTFSKDLKVNERLRKEFARPFGKVIDSGDLKRNVSMKERIYAVGDVTVASLLELGYRPKISIFDYRTERGRAVFPIIKRTYKNPMRVNNRRGVLSPELWNAVRRASVSRQNFGIRVRGEEDLAALACIYFARAGSITMYGLRNKGIAVIRTNLKMKKYVLKVLKEMAAIS